MFTSETTPNDREVAELSGGELAIAREVAELAAEEEARADRRAAAWRRRTAAQASA